MTRTHLRRLGLFVTALFQLLLPTFVSVADARADAAAERGAKIHIEAHGSSTCVPVHSADCAVCRVLSGGATVARSTAAPVFATRIIRAAVPEYARVAVGTLAQCDPSQRAPPIV
jgi:hypothetical protein